MRIWPPIPNLNFHFKILETQIEHLALAVMEQSSRPILSDIEDDDIWDFDIVTLSFKEELSCLTLVETKKNELVIEGESLLKKNAS